MRRLRPPAGQAITSPALTGCVSEPKRSVPTPSRITNISSFT
jgi:hypothetical protein